MPVSHCHSEIWGPPPPNPTTPTAAPLDLAWNGTALLATGYQLPHHAFLTSANPGFYTSSFPIPFHSRAFPGCSSPFLFYSVELDPPSCIEQDNKHTVYCPLPPGYFQQNREWDLAVSLLLGPGEERGREKESTDIRIYFKVRWMILQSFKPNFPVPTYWPERVCMCASKFYVF